jgi:hypothetical protein
LLPDGLLLFAVVAEYVNAALRELQSATGFLGLGLAASAN